MLNNLPDITRLPSNQRMRRVRLCLIFVSLVLSAFTVSAANTASFTAAGSGVISIVDIKDTLGQSIMVPPDFDIFPSVFGPAPIELEKTGSGSLTFAGYAGIDGSGATATVGIGSDIIGSAVPVGVADGVETTSGGIQFINNSGQDVEVTVRFDYAASASASVTDTAVETVSGVFYDIEFQETLGGDPASPCTGGILVDVDETPGFGAPPDVSKSVSAAFFETTMTIPHGSTCAYVSLVQTAGRAEAIGVFQPVPTLGLWAAALMSVMLLLLAIRRAGYRQSR